VDPASFKEVDTIQELPGQQEKSVRIIFHRDNFTDLEDYILESFSNAKFNASPDDFSCTGDVTRVFRTSGGDYSSAFYPVGQAVAPEPFPLRPNSHPLIKATYRAGFLRNVSVDTTKTYFPELPNTQLRSDGCSLRTSTQVRLPSACADFDPPQLGPLAMPLPVTPVSAITSPPPPPVTPSYINGLLFYRVRDPWCLGQGPLEVPTDPESTKAYVGGVSVDLDRNFIGSNEDLLMLITYQSFQSGGSWPYTVFDINNPAELVGEEEVTRLRVDLISTGRNIEVLLQRPQPRSIGDLDLGDEDKSVPPVLVSKLATLEDPFPSLKTESVLVPLSQNPSIDRIRIERIRGTYQLYQIDLYLLGSRGEGN
jgi:hypothetical protein